MYEIKVDPDIALYVGGYRIARFNTDAVDITNDVVTFKPLRTLDCADRWPETVMVPMSRCAIYNFEE